jgi:hypothetical protein
MAIYTTLTLFTSQMLTREGRHGLRKFLGSGMKDVHEPIMLARYIMGPVNHILAAQTAVMKAKDDIPSDAAVSLKITWLVRQILFKRLMEILDTYGWEPDVCFKSKEEEQCTLWITSKHSKYGARYSTGIRGVTQLAFQAYGRSMSKSTLFAVLRADTDNRRIDGRGLIKDQTHLKEFIADDYGLNPDNNVGKYIKRVIQGEEAIGLPYALAAWKESLAKTGSSKRKTTSSTKEGKKAKTSESVSEASPIQAVAGGDPLQAEEPKEGAPIQAEAGGNSLQATAPRRSNRASTYTGDYTEQPDLEDPELEDNSPQPTKKKGCVTCICVTDAIAELSERSEKLTPFEIVKEMETVFDKHFPALGKCLLLADDVDPNEEEDKDPQKMDTADDVDPNEEEDKDPHKMDTADDVDPNEEEDKDPHKMDTAVPGAKDD